LFIKSKQEASLRAEGEERGAPDRFVGTVPSGAPQTVVREGGHRLASVFVIALFLAGKFTEGLTIFALKDGILY